MVTVGEAVAHRLHALAQPEPLGRPHEGAAGLGAEVNEAFYAYVVAPLADKSFASL